MTGSKGNFKLWGVLYLGRLIDNLYLIPFIIKCLLLVSAIKNKKFINGMGIHGSKEHCWEEIKKNPNEFDFIGVFEFCF